MKRNSIGFFSALAAMLLFATPIFAQQAQHR
jgi:hypothetical protein